MAQDERLAGDDVSAADEGTKAPEAEKPQLVAKNSAEKPENQGKGPAVTGTEAVIRAIDRRLGDLGRVLAWKEALKLKAIDQDINNSYYRMWRDDSNTHFRRMVVLKRRQTKLRTHTS